MLHELNYTRVKSSFSYENIRPEYLLIFPFLFGTIRIYSPNLIRLDPVGALDMILQCKFSIIFITYLVLISRIYCAQFIR